MTIIPSPLCQWDRQRLAIVTPEYTICYGQYRACIAATTERLRQFGITPGQYMALLLPEVNIDYIILLMALLHLGVVAVPLNNRFPAEQIEELLADIRCRDMIIDNPRAEFFRHRQFAAKKFVVMTDEQQDELPEVVLAQEATIIFTSGSSGRPKAVLHTYANHYYNALGSNSNISLAPGDRWLLSLPLYHVAGLAILHRVSLAGATIVLPANQATINSLVEQLAVTHLSLVSTQLYRILREHQPQSLASLKAVLLGGSAMPASLLQRARECNLPVYTSYGSSEMASQIATTTPLCWRSGKSLQAAKLLPHRELMISPRQQILVRGKTLFKGYIHDGQLADPRDKDGWFHTGDYGSIDKDGYLSIHGRGDHMFISGGENIHPQEIEQQLCSLPGILQAIVVPLASKEYGARPVAFVHSEGHFVKTEICATLASKMARFKIPEHLLPWPSEQMRGIKPDRQYLAQLALRKLGELP